MAKLQKPWNEELRLLEAQGAAWQSILPIVRRATARIILADLAKRVANLRRHRGEGKE